MHQRGLCAIFLLVCLFCAGRQISHAEKLNLQAGIGYDFLSQKYFLDSATISGADSAFVDWQLSSTYLDDLKGQFMLTYNPLADRKLLIKSSYEQTVDFMRLKTSANLHFRSGRNRINMTGELEWRNRLDDSARYGDSYLFGYGRMKLATPLNETISGVIVLKGEKVDFRSSLKNAYDYHRITGQLGIEKNFANFSFANLNGFITTRQTPDSAFLSYLTVGAEASFFGPSLIGDLDLSLRYESKNYNQPNNQNDQRRLELYGNNQVGLGRNWFTRQEVILETAFFDPNDLINTDYMRLGLAFLAGIDTNGISIAAGPKLEILNEKGSDLDDNENYFESGLKLNLDYMRSVAAFGSLESSVGYRDLKYENDLQTSFIFERLNFMADFRIFSVLHLSLIFGAEWEWHADQKDNSELYLLSSNLTFSF